MEKNGKKKEAKYKHPMGQPIEFYTDNLYELFAGATSTLSGFIELLKDSENDELACVGGIASDLMEYADQQLQKKLEFIEEKFGEISIDIARGEIGMIAGTLLGLNFTPKSQGEARGKEEA